MMKSIKPDEFFKLVSINSNVTDLQTVKDVYYGMIRTISRELKGKQVIELPDWGKFYIFLHKARNFVSINGEPGYLPAKPTVKFSPFNKVKEYFYLMVKEGL